MISPSPLRLELANTFAVVCKLNTLLYSLGGCAVLAEPTSLQLYVDDLHVDEDNAEIEYNNVTRINITCVATGGHPAPVVSFIVDSNADFEQESYSPVCRPRSPEHPTFLANLTCSGTSVLQQYLVDYSTAGRPVGCTARSLGSPDVRLSASFIPRLTGGTTSLYYSLQDIGQLSLPSLRGRYIEYQLTGWA